jgi:2-polyprenyl-3-methyl-5-hydroxy-6-metoxy-1,4-benzoquinol methylase
VSEDHYIARQSAEAFERERLGLLERLADPITLRRLQSLGVGVGWRCLEVGAGHGSIVRWLARQVGPQGRSWPQPLIRDSSASSPGPIS